MQIFMYVLVGIGIIFGVLWFYQAVKFEMAMEELPNFVKNNHRTDKTKEQIRKKFVMNGKIPLFFFVASAFVKYMLM